MKDILVLRDLDQIKAISHPYRIEIFECFQDEQPRSAKQVAEKLGEPHAKVNYHIKSLLKVGILELVDERVKSGIIEKYYLPAAKALVIDKSFMPHSDDDLLESMNHASISFFERIAEDYYKAAENPVDYKKFITHFNEYYLTKDEIKALMGEIDQIISEKIKDKKDKNRKDTNPYNIAILGIPIVNKKRG